MDRTKILDFAPESIQPYLNEGEGGGIAFDTYAWPGGYPLHYIALDGESFCPKCATENLDRIAEAWRDNGPDNTEWIVRWAEVNWEDAALFCVHCHARIPSAYAEG